MFGMFILPYLFKNVSITLSAKERSQTHLLPFCKTLFCTEQTRGATANNTTFLSFIFHVDNFNLTSVIIDAYIATLRATTLANSVSITGSGLALTHHSPSVFSKSFTALLTVA